MQTNTLIQSATTSFKKSDRVKFPTLYVVQGLTASEEITFDVTNTEEKTDGIVDANNDSNWIALLNGGLQISITPTTNFLYIQAPAYYRLVLSSTPANPVTVMRFTFT